MGIPTWRNILEQMRTVGGSSERTEFERGYSCFDMALRREDSSC